MTGLIRASAAAVVVAIGAVAAYISYRHALDVVRAHGESGATAQLVPLTVDGLVYVAGMVLLDAARRNVRAPRLARAALALGIGATVAVNVLHGIAHGPVGATIAAWPAVTLVLSYELLMGMIRLGRTTEAVTDSGTNWETAPTATTDALGEEQDAQIVYTPDRLPDVAKGSAWWPLPELGGAGQGTPVAVRATPLEPEPRAIATGAPEVRGAHAPDATKKPSSEDRVEGLTRAIATAQERFAEVLANGDVPSIRAIRREVRVGHPRAVKVRDALASG